MREGTSIFSFLEGIGQNAQLLLYPSLTKLPSSQRKPALRAARATEFDFLERVGLIASMGICAYLLEPVGKAADLYVARMLAQLLFALPLMGILAMPWLVRRTRRGLRRQTAPP